MAVAVRFVASFESGIEMFLFLDRDAGIGRESESESERKRETQTDASRAAVRYDTRSGYSQIPLTNRPIGNRLPCLWSHARGTCEQCGCEKRPIDLRRFSYSEWHTRQIGSGLNDCGEGIKKLNPVLNDCGKVYISSTTIVEPALNLSGVPLRI